MISVRAISYAEILGAPNAAELLAEYEAECSLLELAPYSPQVDAYAAMERTGNFQCFGVYEGEVLLGFASALVYVVPHCGKRIATVESFFLAGAHRRGRTGHALMNAIEDFGRQRACVLVLYSAVAGSQFEQLLRMLKPYRHSNTVFLRTL